jgi:hypothetical protein
MSFLLRPRIAMHLAILLAASIGAWQSAAAVEPVHATSGVVKKIDKGAKTIAVETADGTEKVFKYTGKTVVEGAREGGKGMEKAGVEAYHGTLEGSHAVVKYTEKGSEATAVGVRDLGKASVKVADGTVEGADKAAHTITVATKDGGKETFDLSRDATVDTSHGAVDAAKWTYKTGDKVTVHYTEDAGKKVAHFIKHL